MTHLFETMRFNGSTGAYYHRSNSYLNEVLDDREGLPITLSLLFIEVAKRKGLAASGVPLPSHFIAKVQLGEKEVLIDAFNGKPISRDDAEKLVGLRLDDEDFKAAEPKAILTRMLTNLLGATDAEEDTERMLGYLDAILALRGGAGGPRPHPRGRTRGLGLAHGSTTPSAHPAGNQRVITNCGKLAL